MGINLAEVQHAPWYPSMLVKFTLLLFETCMGWHNPGHNSLQLLYDIIIFVCAAQMTLA